MTDLVAVCVGSSAFSGSGRIMMSAARALASAGIRVHVVSLDQPFHGLVESTSGRVTTTSPRALSSGALGDYGAFPTLDSLTCISLAEECARVSHAHPRARLLLWGHFLFPFGVAARAAADVLAASGRDVALWLTPAGSDVWELGRDLPHVVKWLLSSDRWGGVREQRVLTYSKPFRDEIVREFALERAPDVFTPAVDAEFLCDARWSERIATRKGRDWLLTTHSNLRPVKRFELLLDVVERLATRNPGRQVTLRVAGPPFKYDPRASNLLVHSLGVRSEVAQHLFDSDVEVNLSVHDSFNLSVVESACLGVPVLTTDCIGARSLLERHGCARFVPTAWARDSDVEACAAELEDVLVVGTNGRTTRTEALRRGVSERQLTRTLEAYLESDGLLT